MDGQLSIFDFITDNVYVPGQMLDARSCGKELTFDEVIQRTGENLLLVSDVMGKYTFYQVVKIVGWMRYEYKPEDTLAYDGKRRFIYEDGTEWNGYVSEDYLDKEKYPHYGEVHELK